MRKRQTARSANTAEPSQTRREIAAEAARIMAEDGVRDFQIAKQKAAARLNIIGTKQLPNNQEIDDALAARLSLFHPNLASLLARLRRLALATMDTFAQFQPRLVGDIVSGHVTNYSVVQLHLTVASPEDLVFFLEDGDIPFKQSEKRLRFGGNRVLAVPLFYLDGEVPIELYVFTPDSVRESPLSAVDGKPMRRLSTRELTSWLIEGSQAPSSDSNGFL